MIESFGKFIVIVIVIIAGVILLWAVLEIFDLMGYIFPGRKKKDFFDE